MRLNGGLDAPCSHASNCVLHYQCIHITQIRHVRPEPKPGLQIIYAYAIYVRILYRSQFTSACVRDLDEGTFSVQARSYRLIYYRRDSIFYTSDHYHKDKADCDRRLIMYFAGKASPDCASPPSPPAMHEATTCSALSRVAHGACTSLAVRSR